MKTILYVRLPCKKIFPGGVVALADCIHKHKPAIKQKILDLSLFERNEYKKVLFDTVGSFSPDLILFSWRDIQIFAPHQDDSVIIDAFNYYYSNIAGKMKSALRGVKAVLRYNQKLNDNLKLINATSKHFCNKKIMLGGSAFSVFPKQLIAKVNEDIIGVIGEGENALLSLINNEDILQQRVIIKRDGKLAAGSNKKGYFDIDKSGPTDYHYVASIFPQFKSYLKEHVGIQTKRGCTQKCLFCLYKNIEGTRIRYRKPEDIGKEIEILHRDFGVSKIWFTDSTFCPNKDSVPFCEQVLDEILKRKVEIQWQGYIRIENLNPSLAKKMLKSGISAFELSLTSGSQKIVDKLHLGFKYDDIWKACKIIKDAGYKNQPIIINYALNAPGETKETLRKSVVNLHKLENIFGKNNIIPYIFFLAVQNNTGLEKLAIKQRHLPSDYDKLTLSPSLIRGLIYNPPPLDKLIAGIYLRASKLNSDNIGREVFKMLEEEMT